METVECKCKQCGSNATLNFFEETFPSFNEEGLFDGEEVVTHDEVICDNPECVVRTSITWSFKPLHQQDCEDDLPF